MAAENKDVKQDKEEPIDIDSILETPEDIVNRQNGVDNSDDVDADNDDNDDSVHDNADEGNESGDEGDNDGDREAIRERRRLERQQKKEWRKETEERQRREREMLRKENEQLQQRLLALEQKSVGAEFAQLDAAIGNTNKAITQIKEQIKYATEAGDGQTVAEATENLFKAQQYANHLNSIKQNALNQTKQVEQRSPVDPRVRKHAESWADKHTWYDPTGGDSDSQITKVIDTQLANEGWNPQEPEYWTELDARLKRYLPHRYAQQEATNMRQRQKTPVAGSGRESGGSSMSTWKLSADRVNAIKEAGAWDDPVLRDKMIRNYRDYDRQNGRK